MALLGGLALSSLTQVLTHDALWLLCANALAVELWIAGAAVGGGLWLPAPLAGTLGLGRGRLTRGELALLVLGTLAASHALEGALELSGIAPDGLLGEIPQRLAGASGLRLAGAMLALGIAPGIAEELLCRGLIQRALSRRLGPGPAIGLAALAFGALHVEPVHAVFAAILGLYLGTAGHLSRSTRAPILCHAANNLAAVTLVVADANGGAAPGSVLVAAALAAACVGWVARAHRRRVPGGERPAPVLQPSAGSDDR